MKNTLPSQFNLDNLDYLLNLLFNLLLYLFDIASSIVGLMYCDEI